MSRPITRHGDHFRRLLQAGRAFSVAVERSGLQPNYARKLAQDWGYLPPAVPRRPKGELHAAIVKGYADGLSPGQIAEQTGATMASVCVIASRLGVTRSRQDAAWARADSRRGFVIPPELRDDYILFRRKRIPAREAAIAMGLLPGDPENRSTPEEPPRVD